MYETIEAQDVMLHDRQPKQYSAASERERTRLARKLNAEYGLMPEDMLRLTGMKLRTPRV